MFGSFIHACYTAGHQINRMDVVMERLNYIWDKADSLKDFQRKNVVQNGIKPQIQKLLLSSAVVADESLHPKLQSVNENVENVLELYNQDPNEQYSAFFWVNDDSNPGEVVDFSSKLIASNSTTQFETNDVGVMIFRTSNLTEQEENREFFEKHNGTSFYLSLITKLQLPFQAPKRSVDKLPEDLAQQQVATIENIRAFPAIFGVTYVQS